MEQVIFEDDTFTQTEYDALGRRTAFIDPEGIRTEYEYDQLGRLEKVIQWVTQPGETVAERLETTYTYDELGRLIEAKDAKHQVTTYEYDEAGRRSAVIRPGGERSEMTYYDDGSLKHVTEYFNTGTTNPEAMTYVYDEQGRLQTKELVNDPDVHYRYDINGQLEEIRVGDDPDAVDTEITSFAYDEQGRLTGRKDPDAPTFTNSEGEFTIAYTYDAAGNVTSVETAAGKTEYTYDAWNRLKTVKQDSDTEATEYTYDPAGNLIQTTFPNGVVETREYDDLNRLETITTTDTQGDGDSSNDVVLAQSEYELNAAGHRTQVIQSLWNETTQTLDVETTNYTYDELYRLLAVQTVGSDGVSYTYDEVGNRASMQVGDTDTTYVYDANDQLQEIKVDDQLTVEYDYDPDGNLIREAVTGGDTLIYTWDDQNRLVAVAKEGEAPFVTYEYDDDNIRVSQTVEGNTTEFVVDKNRAYAQVLAEYIGSQLIEEYVYGLDLIEQTDGTTGDEAFFGVDGLGSTVVLTDENGDVVQTYEDVVQTYEYDEFGELEDAPTDLKTDYLFAGEQFDESLGDYYLRQRYYDPTIGRFTRRDTYEGRLAEPITLNKFVYGHSNPVSYSGL